MTTKGYTGVILAAGRGTRMAPFSDSYPKPILPICNKPIIEYQVDTMRKLGIRDLIVLIGHKGFEISKILGDGGRLGVSIRYIEQTSTLGIAHAVGRLEVHTERPFLLFLGDIFFIPQAMSEMFRLFEEQGGGAVLATKEETDAAAIRKNFAITLGPDGFATRVIEKPRHAQNRLKGVGIYLFDLTIFDAIRHTPRTAMRDEYEITDSIQVLIQDGYPVRPCNAVADDINLTTPADLLVCNLLQARSAPPESLVGRDTRVHEAACLEECVIGDDVEVRYPIRISSSVIFDHTCVKSNRDLRNYILTPDCIVDCNPWLQPGSLRPWTTPANVLV
jgi:glucose-1-phosphate thymidylyltransferase